MKMQILAKKKKCLKSQLLIDLVKLQSITTIDDLRLELIILARPVFGSDFGQNFSARGQAQLGPNFFWLWASQNDFLDYFLAPPVFGPQKPANLGPKQRALGTKVPPEIMPGLARPIGKKILPRPGPNPARPMITSILDITIKSL